MTAKASTQPSLSNAQQALFVDVREMFPTIDAADCLALCKTCDWNPDRVNSMLAENGPNFPSSNWKEIDRTSKKKKSKEEGKTNISDAKKKKTFSRRPRRGKFDRKQNRGKGKDGRKGKDAKSKRDFNSATSKHLIQRTTNSVSNSTAGSWAQRAKTKKPQIPTRAPQIQSSHTQSPPHESSSKSGEIPQKENSITNSNPELMAAPPGINMANSAWTNVHQPEEPEQEVETANRPETYSDFFDPEQYNDPVPLTEDGTMYSEPRANPASSYTGSHSSQMYPTSKFQEPNFVKPEPTPPSAPSFQSDHDIPSSAGVEFRLAGDEPDFSTADTRGPTYGNQEFKFGDVSNIPLSQSTATANATGDSRSRPVSDISSAIGTMPPYKHNFHGQTGVTMPPANVMFQSEFLQLPPEMEEHRGGAIYQFGVDYTEERKVQANDHQTIPEHIPPHLRGDPAQAAPRQLRSEFGTVQSSPYQRAEVNVERTHTVNSNVSRPNHDLNISTRQVDNRFARIENTDQNQHNNFTEIGILGEVHTMPPHMQQRMDQFEERKSNQLEIDDTRNQNRINNMHMVPNRPLNRPDNNNRGNSYHFANPELPPHNEIEKRQDFPHWGGVPAEVRNQEPSFLNEAKHKEPATHVYAENQQPNQPEHMHQPNYTQQYMSAHQPNRPHQNPAFKQKTTTVGGFTGKEPTYEQQQTYGVDPLQQHNLEADAPAYSPTPPDPQYGHHATMVTPNTEYKQQSHHYPNTVMTNQIHYTTATPTYYQVPTYQQYTQPSHWPPPTLRTNTYPAPRPTVGHPTYPTQVVPATNPLYAAQFPYAPVR